MKSVSTIPSDSLCCFPIKKYGKILGYKDQEGKMPSKIIDMGLLPGTIFKVLYQAPFHGPLYVEYGQECSKMAIRIEQARFIIVEAISL